MSGIGYKGYYINITGERLEELLQRNYIVPTLKDFPSENTLTWIDGKYTTYFKIGDFVRVVKEQDIKFFRLINIESDKAVWKEVILEHQDISNKQDVIEDLETIRQNALKGSNALQSVPEEYITNEELEEVISNIKIPEIDLTEYVKEEDLNKKQDVLKSGINIKTINGKSILGEGNLQISGEGGSGNSKVIILSQSEYDSLIEQNLIEETSIYFIKEDNTPIALYIGTILIAQKDELGNISFPYNFPIIF